MRPDVVAFLATRLGHFAAQLLTPDYITMLCLAFVLAGALTLRLGQRFHLELRRASWALVAVYVGALVGARGFSVLPQLPLAIDSGDWRVLLSGGLTAYGGFLGGALAGYLVLRKAGHWPLFDVAAPALGLGTAVTRVGCLLGGCDYGAIVSAQWPVPWGLRYPAGSPAFAAHAHAGLLGPYSTESLAVHPTPVYELLLGLVLAALSWLWLRRRYQRGQALDGRVFLGTAAGYAVGRFFIELLRGDLDRGIFWGGLSTSQLTSLAVLAAVLITLGRRGRN